ncbi:MAG: ferredoxin, partial [Polymorphobacter sp.]
MSRYRSPTLARVVDGQLCVGCGLCAAIAPEAILMQPAPPLGSRRPVESAAPSPAAEAAIADSCPGAVVAPWSSPAPVDVLWGPLVSVHTGYALDGEVRHAGSSGGV